MMASTRMCDLPQELVVEIFKRVPIISLKAVRSTCKTWEAITKNSVVLSKEAPHQFLTMNAKVYSLRYRLGEDLVVDVPVQQVDLLNDQLEISNVYHCDGLVLCIPKDNSNSKLMLWNPYLCQTRWIGPRGGENFKPLDIYAIGYSEVKKRRGHKIVRFFNDYSAPGLTRVFRSEIFEISSDSSSWRALKVKREWEVEIDEHQRGVSVKGNTYFFAHERLDDEGMISDVEDFLLCFDFTKERFGPRLPLPFHWYNEDCVTFSSFLRRDDDEQLAVLFSGCESSFFEIWVTLALEPDHVSWSKFLLVETGPLYTALKFELNYGLGGSFLVDEENQVAVVFELDGYLSSVTYPHQHTAFVFGQAGYIQSVNLGEAPKMQHLCPYSGKSFQTVRPPLVCSSSYRPSLVQVKQPPLPKRKRKATHV